MQVKCIANLDLNTTLYLDGLSRVFFKKENLKTRDGYWVTTFYSFCIQATVRRLLQKTSSDGVILDTSTTNEYLHLAINLFIASSGAYDPLVANYVLFQSSTIEDIVLLKEVLGGPVTSSSDCLRRLFEIEDAPAPKTQNESSLLSQMGESYWRRRT